MRPAVATQLLSSGRADKLGEVAQVLGFDSMTEFSSAEAKELLSETEVLLTSWGCPPVDAVALAAAPRLSAIVHAAGTVKGHVTEACWERGIVVTSTAAANAISVAEYTLAAILFSGKRALFPGAGPAGIGNFNKTVGIVGASHVGRRVLELLRHFDFRTLLYDPYLAPDEHLSLGAEAAELDELLARSDVVSLHAPAIDETRHMLDRRRLGLISDGATLINTARGWLIDSEALEEELSTGRFYAVIDTTEPEPLPDDSPLRRMSNVFLTPHIAGAMGDETLRMTDLALEEIARFARGEPFRYNISREALARMA